MNPNPTPEGQRKRGYCCAAGNHRMCDLKECQCECHDAPEGQQESETPRTDAVILEYGSQCAKELDVPDPLPEHARTLERELQAATQRVKELEKLQKAWQRINLPDCVPISYSELLLALQSAERERDIWKREYEDEKDAHYKALNQRDALQLALTAETARREKAEAERQQLQAELITSLESELDWLETNHESQQARDNVKARIVQLKTNSNSGHDGPRL